MPNGMHGDPNSRLSGQASHSDPIADALRERGRHNPSDVVIDADRDRPGIEMAEALRCGVPDLAPGDIRIQAYGSPGGRWSRFNLTWNVVNVAPLTPQFPVLTQQFVTGTVIPQARAAFQQWQAAQPLFNFTPAMGPAADISIQFGPATLNPRFGTAGGVSGSAGYPERGNVDLDAAEPWSATMLFAVLLHELGHALGLSHSTAPASTMYPFAPLATTLDAETIRAIRDLYGWPPQIPLRDRGSAERPSLAVAGPVPIAGPSVPGTAYMAWRGIPGDDAVYWSRLDSGGWSPQQKVLWPGSEDGPGSEHGPCLATGFTSFGSDGTAVTGLFMAWDGVPGDTTIYFAQNPTLSGWTNQQPVPGVGTSHRPALALFNGAMRMAWKGIPGDSAIYWSSFNGTSWSAQQQILGRGTSDGPALVALGARLYMFWKGIEDDTRVFYSWIGNQSNSIWQAQREVVFTSAETAGMEEFNIGTTHAPSATVRGNRIVLAWKGIPGDTGLYFATLEPNDQWSGQVDIPGVGSSHCPALADVGGQLHMAWKGIPGDTGLYYLRLG